MYPSGFVLPSFEFIVSPRKLNLSKPFGERQQQMINAIERIVEDGQAQGTIRKDIDAESIAWEFTILAWAEDVARPAGLDQYISTGIANRILDRFIAGIEAVVGECP